MGAVHFLSSAITLLPKDGDDGHSWCTYHHYLPILPGCCSTDLPILPCCSTDLPILPGYCSTDFSILPCCCTDLPILPCCSTDLPILPCCCTDLPILPCCSTDLPILPCCSTDLPILLGCSTDLPIRQAVPCYVQLTFLSCQAAAPTVLDCVIRDFPLKMFKL